MKYSGSTPCNDAVARCSSYSSFQIHSAAYRALWASDGFFAVQRLREWNAEALLTVWEGGDAFHGLHFAAEPSRGRDVLGGAATVRESDEAV